MFGSAAPYVSPEQISGAALDARSDIFSFGVLLYHLTAGRRGLVALGEVIERWVRHLLPVEVEGWNRPAWLHPTARQPREVEARALLARHGVTYVALCGKRSPGDLAKAALDASLWGRLQAKDIPSWLEPAGGDGPFAVYRVKS